MKSTHYDNAVLVFTFLMMFTIAFAMLLATPQEVGTCVLLATVLGILACVSAMLEREASRKESLARLHIHK